ncbi:MAG: SPOR domain-containing protein [Bacteroidales bacterium]|nr:SPOR domain-containing protein [Candidatus Physcousia equi]
MNKSILMGAALTLAFAFTSCKSSESAYKKAYEKAQAAQQNTGYQQQTTPTYGQTGYSQQQQTTPVEVTPVNPTTTTTTPVQDYSNVSVRTENVTVVSGNALKAYSVVVGSFSVKANAEGLKTKLGNGARVVKAMVNGNEWYRVVAGSFDTKNEAAQFRATKQSTYPDAWLLYAK